MQEEKNSLKDYILGFVALLASVLGFLLFRKEKSSTVTEGKLAEATQSLKTQENDNAIKTQDAITDDAVDAFRKSDSGKGSGG